MARSLRLSLILLLIIYTFGWAESAIGRHSSSTDFIKSSCRTTRYPDLCVKNLVGYAGVIGQSQRKLAMTALSVSISRTGSSASFVKKVLKTRGIKSREYKAVQDCIENMGDSVDRLSQSVRELGHMGETAGSDFMWHISNVQTWVSAALTDQNTCLDAFAGRPMDGKIKTAIRSRVLHVAQLTSNALALVNRFASAH